MWGVSPPPRFGSLGRTHRCPSWWHGLLLANAAPSSWAPAAGTFQHDRETLEKQRSPVGFVIGAADEEVLTEGEDRQHPGRQGGREIRGGLVRIPHPAQPSALTAATASQWHCAQGRRSCSFQNSLCLAEGCGNAGTETPRPFPGSLPAQDPESVSPKMQCFVLKKLLYSI